jgi:uncharacterized caspase-like protein
MPRYLFLILLACVAAGNPFRGAIAESSPNDAVKDIARQNPLIADVVRSDPDALRSLLQRLEILTTAQRDSGAARSGAGPTAAESAQIKANPVLRQAYASDRAATIALLRATNHELDMLRRRGPLAPHRLIALVIGNNGDATWGKLGTPANDAALISRALTRQGFELFEGHPWLDLDRRQLLLAVRDFSREITPGTVALVYYAGHGVRSAGRNFLVPAEAMMPTHEGDYDRDLVAVDDVLLRQMQQAGGALNIIILDACEDSSAAASAASSNPVTRGFAPVIPPGSGTIVISSTGPNDVALDSVGHAADSPFASAFAAAIEEPGLEIRDVFDQVEVAVDRASNHRQQPWIAYSAVGRFYFGAPTPATTGFRSAVIDDAPFHCPAAGTTITLDVLGGSVKGVYQANDPADPALCRIVTSAGETRTLLYNFFDTRSIIGQSSIRAGMDNLLSKHANGAEFTVSYRLVNQFFETWRRLGTETLLIGDRYVRVIKFDRVRRQIPFPYDGVPPVGEWLVWYDPASNLFVKSERRGPHGTPALDGDMPGTFNIVSLSHD